MRVPINIIELVREYEENLLLIEKLKFANDVIKAKLKSVTPKEGIRVEDYIISYVKGKETVSFNSKLLKQENLEIYEKYAIRKIGESSIKIKKVNKQ